MSLEKRERIGNETGNGDRWGTYCMLLGPVAWTVDTR